MLRRSISLAVLVLVLLLQTTLAPLRALQLGPKGLAPLPLPAGSIPLVPPARADFDHDGRLESLSLTAGRLAILSAGNVLWQSPASWNVIQAAITDLDRDGTPEAALLVWRPFRPWPVDRWLPSGGRIAAFHDSSGESCHLILIGWRGNAYRELWAGSALAEPLRSFAVGDLNGDGLQELVTLEGSYADPRSAPANALKVWEWNGFGFSVVSSRKGTFRKLALVQPSSGPVLVVVP